MELNQRVFVVSGVASGLGLATARMILTQKGRVIGLDLKELSSSDLPDSMPGQIVTMMCDVRSEEQVRKCLEKGYDRFGEIHGAVTCAGIAPARLLYSSKKGSHPYELFLKVLEVNLGGTFNIFNSCIPYMIHNDPDASGEKGILVATSSVAAIEGQAGQTAYAASKGGVSGMILPMARELSRHRIRVNAIAPGIFRTPMVSEFPLEVQEELTARILFPDRLEDPEEFATLVQSIIRNSYLNGTMIRLDGGVRMQ